MISDQRIRTEACERSRQPFAQDVPESSQSDITCDSKITRAQTDAAMRVK